MAKQYWYPRRLGDTVAHYNNFAEKLPDHQVELNLTATDLQMASDDAQYVEYVFGAIIATRGYAQGLTDYRDLLMDGPESAPLGALPALNLPMAPTVVLPGVKPRHLALVGRIKAASGYNEGIGEILQIVGDEETLPQPGTLQPVMEIALEAGRPLITWGMQKPAFALEIWADYNDGAGWIRAFVDFTPPDQLDAHQLPAPGSSAIWKYKAIFVDRHGEQMGQWSADYSISVAGTV